MADRFGAVALRAALIEAAEELDLPLTVRQVDALAAMAARLLGGAPVVAPAPVVTPTFSEASS